LNVSSVRVITELSALPLDTASAGFSDLQVINRRDDTTTDKKIFFFILLFFITTTIT